MVVTVVMVLTEWYVPLPSSLPLVVVWPGPTRSEPFVPVVEVDEEVDEEEESVDEEGEEEDAG